MNDVIVVLPGIMGSTLYRNGSPVWEPSGDAVLAGLASLFRSVKTLQLPVGVGDNHPGDGVTAEALMPDVRLPLGIWTFDLGYTALVDFLATTFDVNTDAGAGPRNLITFPYDWRLSNRYNGAELGKVVQPALVEWRAQGGECAEAKLVFICHSMGGLVARWYIDRLGGAEVTRRLITLGTPHRGALNALDQLGNGVKKGIGPFKLSLTNFARSLPALHQLLPEYACIEKSGPNDLVKTTEIAVPNLVTADVADAMEFHRQLDAGRATHANDYRLHAIAGYNQPTATTARIKGDEVVTIRSIAGNDDLGDATVPRLASVPIGVGTDLALSVADNHGGLVHNRAAFDIIEGILTARVIEYRSTRVMLSIDIEEVLEHGQTLVVRAEIPAKGEPLELVVVDEDGKQLGAPTRLMEADGRLMASKDLPAPGLYRATVSGVGSAGASVQSITTAVFQWPSETDLDPT
jgi:pimeloyl-ACP methyl ester carboxylesterase